MGSLIDWGFNAPRLFLAVIMMYTVTRQIQHPDGTHMVEVSAGGFDYVNPDMMGEKYEGEGETFDDPREAVRTAIDIRNAWQRDAGVKIEIGYGDTLGMTMPFDASDAVSMLDWADREFAALKEAGEV